MRKLLTFAAAALFAASMFAQPLSPPRKANEFVIHMADGSQKLLSSYRGKVVVMAFMYTTCTHCQHTAGLLAKIQTEYANKGVQMLGATIDQDAKAGTPGFIKLTGANFPVGYSTPDQAMKFLGGPSEGWYVPMLAFVDASGMLRSEYIVLDPGDVASKFIEAQDGDPKKNDPGSIRKEIDKLLKSSPTAAKTTPAKTAATKSTAGKS